MWPRMAQGFDRLIAGTIVSFGSPSQNTKEMQPYKAHGTDVAQGLT